MGSLKSFILQPDITPNLVIWSNAGGIDVSRCEGYKRRSSQYNESLWLRLHQSMPNKLVFSLRETARGSVAILNNRGDKGHPCLVPLKIGKWSNIRLLVHTEACGLEYKRFTQLLNFCPNPNFLRAANR